MNKRYTIIPTQIILYRMAYTIPIGRLQFNAPHSSSSSDVDVVAAFLVSSFVFVSSSVLFVTLFRPRFFFFSICVKSAAASLTIVVLSSIVVHIASASFVVIVIFRPRFGFWADDLADSVTVSLLRANSFSKLAIFSKSSFPSFVSSSSSSDMRCLIESNSYI